MFYRFHDDGHGSVDAEARQPGLEPYLGLHYPASDIPAQARQLYLKNWLRLIVDARATPVQIVPTLRPDTQAPLDLSFAVLRSVSPIHLEYMANMGVRASMSMSLIVKNRLWGLISCLDHTGPRRISYEMRAACEFIARLTSLTHRRARGPRAARGARLAPGYRKRAGRGHARRRRGGRRAFDPARPPDGAVGARGRRRRRGGRRGGTCDVRPDAATSAHPGHRDVARELGRARGVLDHDAGHAISRGASGQRCRQRAIDVRAARRSSAAAVVVPPGDHQDGALGRRSDQGCLGRRQRALAAPSFVCALAAGGETARASVDG